LRVSLKHAAILCLAVSMVTPAFAQNGGADTYKAKCLMCHGATGLGDSPAGKALKAASFRDPAAVKASDTELIGIVTKGKNKMPAYEGKLTDAQIKAAVAYIRTLQK
jgi:cytochrome c6